MRDERPIIEDRGIQGVRFVRRGEDLQWRKDVVRMGGLTGTAGLIFLGAGRKVCYGGRSHK